MHMQPEPPALVLNNEASSNTEAIPATSEVFLDEHDEATWQLISSLILLVIASTRACSIAGQHNVR